MQSTDYNTSPTCHNMVRGKENLNKHWEKTKFVLQCQKNNNYWILGILIISYKKIQDSEFEISQKEKKLKKKNKASIEQK